MEKFWVVWSEKGGKPSVQHSTKELADAEAKRLAEKEGHGKFYVYEMSPLGYYEIQRAPVVWTDVK